MCCPSGKGGGTLVTAPGGGCSALLLAGSSGRGGGGAWVCCTAVTALSDAVRLFQADLDGTTSPCGSMFVPGPDCMLRRSSPAMGWTGAFTGGWACMGAGRCGPATASAWLSGTTSRPSSPGESDESMTIATGFVGGTCLAPTAAPVAALGLCCSLSALAGADSVSSEPMSVRGAPAAQGGQQAPQPTLSTLLHASPQPGSHNPPSLSSLESKGITE